MSLVTEQFTRNPFSEYTAEREPDILEYAVRPPYFIKSFEAAYACKSMFLFGNRGSGKSATRISVYEQIWKNKKEGKMVPLCVNLTDYVYLFKGGHTKVSAAKLIDEIVFISLEKLLCWLVNLEDAKRELYLDGLSDVEKSKLNALINFFYLSRDDMSRELSASRTLETLDQAWKNLGPYWIQKKWGTIASALSGIIAHYSKKNDVNIEAKDLKALIYSDATDKTASTYVLSRLVEVVRSFEFTGITVMVDKLDETEFTTTSSEKCANILWPLISDVRLMEYDGLGVNLFLWDRIRVHYTGKDYPVRFDKLANYTIQWNPNQLKEMLNRRVEYFSGKRLSGIAEIFDRTVNHTVELDKIIKIGIASPREIIRIFDQIIAHHDMEEDRKAGDLISEKNIKNGIDSYCNSVVRTIYEHNHILHLAKIGKPIFVNKDLQDSLKINANSARSKIQKWENAGMVAAKSTRLVDGDQGGKPMNEYHIIDDRLAHVISNRMVDIPLDLSVAEED